MKHRHVNPDVGGVRGGGLVGADVRARHGDRLGVGEAAQRLLL
jgi:hypothetical protein